MQFFTIFAGDGDKIIPTPTVAQGAIFLAPLLICLWILPLLTSYIYKRAIKLKGKPSKIINRKNFIMFGLLYLLAIPFLWLEWRTNNIPIFPVFMMAATFIIYFKLKKLKVDN